MFKPSLSEYLAQADIRDREIKLQKLKKELSTAIAWGVADNESRGLTQSEAVHLLHKSLSMLIILEDELKSQDKKRTESDSQY